MALKGAPIRKQCARALPKRVLKQPVAVLQYENER